MATEVITAGSEYISDGKDEDRGTIFLQHTNQGFSEISSFSIFDGHNGNIIIPTYVSSVSWLKMSI
jgi:hypothetical protein